MNSISINLINYISIKYKLCESCLFYRQILICFVLIFIANCNTIPKKPADFNNEECLNLYYGMIQENRSNLPARILITTFGISFSLFAPAFGMGLIAVGMPATQTLEYIKIKPIKNEWSELKCDIFP